MRTLVGAADPEEPPPLVPQVTLTTNTTNVVWSPTMPSFVCEKCKAGDHDACPGNTRCDCQHKSQK